MASRPRIALSSAVVSLAVVTLAAPLGPARASDTEPTVTGSPVPSGSQPSPRRVMVRMPAGGHRMHDDSGTTEIPFTMAGEHMLIPVTVDGSEPFNVILDTGMPFNGVALSPSPRTELLDLSNPDGMRVKVAGVDSSEPPPEVGMGVTLGLPGVDLLEQMVLVHPLPGGGGPPLPGEPEGVIGLSVFEDMVVEIDHDREVVTLTEPERFDPSGAGEVVPLRFGAMRIPQIDCTLELEPGRSETVGLVVDTGAPYVVSLTLGPDDPVAMPDDAMELAAGFTSWGRVVGRASRARSLNLGGFALNDVPVVFYEEGAEGVPPSGDQGILGGPALARFHVTFDYPNHRMFVRPNSRVSEPFPFTTTGLSVRRNGDGLFEAVAVFPGTPAGEAGLEEGDIILSVDGRPAAEYGEDGLRELFRTEDVRVTLEVSRNGKRREVVLLTRRLI